MCMFGCLLKVIVSHVVQNLFHMGNQTKFYLAQISLVHSNQKWFFHQIRASLKTLFFKVIFIFLQKIILFYFGKIKIPSSQTNPKHGLFPINSTMLPTPMLHAKQKKIHMNFDKMKIK
jgi:hypothetical protein